MVEWKSSVSPQKVLIILTDLVRIFFLQILIEILGLFAGKILSIWEFCFKVFVDRVKNWFSFNKWRAIVALGYDNGFFAPGRCSKAFEDCKEGDSSTEPYVVAYNLIKCHVAASLRYHLKYQVELTFFFSLMGI